METPVQTTDEAAFVPDDISAIIRESVDSVLQPEVFSQEKVGQWTSTILESCIKRLAAQNKPFKYVVTCLIWQKTGAGLHTAASCYWDNGTDGSRTMKLEYKTMYCICSVFGLAI